MIKKSNRKRKRNNETIKTARGDEAPDVSLLDSMFDAGMEGSL